MNEVYNAGDPNLLLDLQNLETISSAGLSVLLSSNKRIRKKRGQMAILIYLDFFARSQSFILNPFASARALLCAFDRARGIDDRSCLKIVQRGPGGSVTDQGLAAARSILSL